jgi:hypothetical protein
MYNAGDNLAEEYHRHTRFGMQNVLNLAVIKPLLHHLGYVCFV